MKQFKEMSETEFEIMRYLWEQQQPISFSQILTYFNDSRHRNWKKQTLSTLLLRLHDKGFATSSRVGRMNYYYFTLTLNQYENLKARHIIDSMYDASLSKFLDAYYEGKITEQEYDEVMSWIENHEQLVEVNIFK